MARQEPEPGISSGAWAHERIERQLRRLRPLQQEVLADRDPEPLHQLRVSLRRLRTALLQFGPALVLPAGVSPRRIAALARCSSRCRDLDVLGERLEQELMPQLPEAERKAVARAGRRLARERARAFATMAHSLQHRHSQRLLEKLERWRQQPRFTALGEEPLEPWLADWQAPFTAGLFLDPGWRVSDPLAEELHGLRKRIKAARYALESLEPWWSPAVIAWGQQLRQAQQHLGALHDRQILQRTLEQSQCLRQGPALEGLRRELARQSMLAWEPWRELAEAMLQTTARQRLQQQLLALPDEVTQAQPAAAGANPASS